MTTEPRRYSSLQIEDLRMDGGTQPRVGLDDATIADYADTMAAGGRFPAVTAFYDGSAYWLADGFHRVRAAERAGLLSIDTDVVQGTREDAQWYSFSANKAHGMRRTNEDKQRAVRAALEHPKSAGLSDRRIAVHVGVDHVTVGNWRSKLSGEFHQMERTVERNGTTYEMNVSNIGKRAESRSVFTSATVTQPEVQPFCERPIVGSSPIGGSKPIIQPISRSDVWAAQETKNFTREFLRLLRSYEKSHPPVLGVLITRTNGVATDIEISFEEQEQTA